MKSYRETEALYDAADIVKANVIAAEVARLAREAVPNVDAVMLSFHGGHWHVARFVDEINAPIPLSQFGPDVRDRIDFAEATMRGLLHQLDGSRTPERVGIFRPFGTLAEWELRVDVTPSPEMLAKITAAQRVLADLAADLGGAAQ